VSDSREKNEARYREYLRYREKIIRQTGGMINLEEMGKPESDPPVTDSTLDAWSDPRVAQTVKNLEAIHEEMKDEKYYLWQMLWIVSFAESADWRILTQWEKGDSTDERLLLRLFRVAVKHVLDRLEERHPGFEIVVKPRQEKGEQEATSRIEAAYQDRKEDTEESLRELHRDWCFLRYSCGYNSIAARIEVGKWHGVNPKKVERAITFCNKELANSSPPCSCVG